MELCDYTFKRKKYNKKPGWLEEIPHVLMFGCISVSLLADDGRLEAAAHVCL